MGVRVPAGLHDVEAVESSITAITGEGLFLRGMPLDTLLEHATFEEAAFLLWHDRRPSTAELVTLRHSYAKAWHLPPDLVPLITHLPAGTDPLWALQAALPHMGHVDPDHQLRGHDVERQRAVRVLAQVPAVLACRHWGMPVARLDPVAPLAPQVLRALGAKLLSPAIANAALILYADHELAASTFVARITAAAGSGLYDGLAAALAVLKGPLHGGSTLEVATLIRHLAESRHLPAALDEVLASGRRIPGFGHSVYQGRDPRATHFRRLAEQTATGEARRWIEAAFALEERVQRERGLSANVDLFGATFMHAAGIKDNSMVALFAVARTAGWLAHMLEQYENNLLIRPRAHYTGTLDRVWEENPKAAAQ
jgi:citrate synthase